MPWTARDAYRHSKKAATPHLQRLWSNVANAALHSGSDDASAIRQANAAVARAKKSPAQRTRKPKAQPK